MVKKIFGLIIGGILLGTSLSVGKNTLVEIIENSIPNSTTRLMLAFAVLAITAYWINKEKSMYFPKMFHH